jgi:hypothetical protein
MEITANTAEEFGPQREKADAWWVQRAAEAEAAGEFLGPAASMAWIAAKLGAPDG